MAAARNILRCLANDFPILSNRLCFLDIPDRQFMILGNRPDNRYLLVSNWHSRNNSVLEMNKDLYPYGKVISTIPVSAIPRGIAVDDKNNKSYIAVMGGSTIVRVDNQTWNRRYREYTQKIQTGSLYEMAEVFRDLSVLSEGKELSFGERRMLEKVEELLVSEISVAKAKSADRIKGELAEIVAMH